MTDKSEKKEKVRIIQLIAVPYSHPFLGLGSDGVVYAPRIDSGSVKWSVFVPLRFEEDE